MPKIKDLLSEKNSKVVTISPDETLRNVVQQLTEYKIGSLLVVADSGDIKGIITERDMLRVIRDNESDFATMKVSEVMTKDLYVGLVDDDLDYVINMMTEFRFRHMPVLEGKNLIGLVSIGDVVKNLNQARKFEVRHLRDYITGNYP